MLVGFPGAFTPVCTGNHLPEYNFLHKNFQAKGVEVIGLAVNDPFVMKKFAEKLKGDITFISDGSGILTSALDGGLDLTPHGLGFRTRRFSILIENGQISKINDEEGGALTVVSKAETMLESLN